ncbi:MAG: hypothetical protein ACLQUY_13550 [Ktedonobacterales bacterium]
MDLTNEQWNVLEPLIGDLPKRADGRGRPWRSSREVRKRYSVDLTNGCPVGRRTGSIPTVPDMPPAVPALGPRRDV